MAKGVKTGGRKKGSLNQSTEDTRNWASKLKKKHGVDSIIAEVMESGELRDKLVVWKLLTEYERGKPVQPHAGENGGAIPVTIVNDLGVLVTRNVQ
jgi:hypothetical protein